ncbi:site-specific integrase [Embleya sp. NPDC008237]|uniref:site-specific integrase n=1 Tax=Embleya sp. NPDC008237 TaxID=3363978 RepID=UPI0036E899B8
MVSLAYDGALRREELVQLSGDDFDPAYSLIRLRAETTKSKRSREVTYGEATGRLFMAYLAERRSSVGRVARPLLRSMSNRNPGGPLGASSWSKFVERLSSTSGVNRLSTHTATWPRPCAISTCPVVSSQHASTWPTPPSTPTASGSSPVFWRHREPHPRPPADHASAA